MARKSSKVAKAEVRVGQSLADAKLERWTPVEVDRKVLKGAPYNPRTISDVHKRKLQAQLKKNGLVSPITWNKRTGNIVGGHQRIAALDAIMGTDDYKITVAQVDVDEAEEKALNVALNNDQNMGEFDIEKLGKLLEDAAIDLEKTGFDTADLYDMFGHGMLQSNEQRSQALSELGTKLREMQDLYKNVRQTNVDKNNVEFYCLMVFKNAEELTAFLEGHKLPDNRYQMADNLIAAISSATERKLLGSASGSGSALQATSEAAVKMLPSKM